MKESSEPSTDVMTGVGHDEVFTALFTPRSIAVIGASRNPAKVSHAFLVNLKNSNYKGAVVPVNPAADEVLGLKCYPKLTDYDGMIDLSIIVVPPKFVKQAIEESAKAGAKAVAIITAGFKEVSEDGAKLEEEIVATCQRNKVRLMGPNCLGLINTQHDMNATFAPSFPPPGGISIISQSGALCVALLDLAATRKIGLSKVISIGNKADLNEVSFLEALSHDADTKVVAGYLESITDGDDFMRIAEEVASTKPVVILKVGTTAAGAMAASSHTGSLAGADMAYGAAFKRAGVIRAENIEALFDYALAFDNQPLPRGKRVCIITNAGGPGIMATDAVENLGLEVAPLSDETKGSLRKVLPAAAAFNNPVDVIGDADPDLYTAAFESVQDDPNVDAVVVVVTNQNMTQPVELAKKLAAAHKGKKPLIAAFLGGAAIQPGCEELMKLGIPNYASPERAVRALEVMCDYAAWRERPPRLVTRFPVNRRRVSRILKWQKRIGVKEMGEVEAKEILRAYDFNILPGHLARTAEEAVEQAERIGYPVVLKICSPEVVHKSDFGGVRINLSTPDQVRDAFDIISLRVKRYMPNANLRGIFVEKMGFRGREVILGMTRDPQFGPMLMFGLGGIFVEVMKDVTFHLAPITEEEAMQMLKSTRSYALLRGARGQAGVDIDAIAGALQRISQLATDYPQIAELDINPFIVGEVGETPYAADARMTISDIPA